MTVQVTAAGQSVAVMRDKSGNGRHMVQASALSRPTYQTDGVLHWLQFDGVDDSFGASAFNWGSDEATLVFGARKTLDTATGVLFESSAASTSSAGALAIFAPPAGALNAGNYDFRTKGTTSSDLRAGGYPTPNSAVLTGLAKISTDLAKLRVNGVEAASSGSDQGTGAFGAHPIYIGRRNNSIFPFQGRLYGATLFNRVLTAPEILSTEAWISAKTGAGA
ncbi:LamG domain-containing protein [Frigidibacter mobilis]|uniref:LamG domain-containing protein n=1 Tax=Frigidibacter mobilis TaxID=1335048 RepID=UPI0014126B39|nr:LamG domain-containing protein [Frigidibacter mobilis]